MLYICTPSAQWRINSLYSLVRDCTLCTLRRFPTNSLYFFVLIVLLCTCCTHVYMYHTLFVLLYRCCIQMYNLYTKCTIRVCCFIIFGHLCTYMWTSICSLASIKSIDYKWTWYIASVHHCFQRSIFYYVYWFYAGWFLNLCKHCIHDLGYVTMLFSSTQGIRRCITNIDVFRRPRLV